MEEQSTARSAVIFLGMYEYMIIEKGYKQKKIHGSTDRLPPYMSF